MWLIKKEGKQGQLTEYQCLKQVYLVQLKEEIEAIFNQKLHFLLEFISLNYCNKEEFTEFKEDAKAAFKTRSKSSKSGSKT